MHSAPSLELHRGSDQLQLWPDGGAPAAAAASGLAEIFQLTDRLYRAQTLEQALDAALDAISAVLGCGKCSILLAGPDGVLRFAAWRELSADYRLAVEGHSPWDTDTVDPPAIFVSDVCEADFPDWLRDRLSVENIASLAFIPLVEQGRVHGKFMAYYDRPHAYTPGERALAVTIARQLGFCIQKIGAERERLQTLHRLRESEHRFRTMSENAPVMIWMSDEQGRCLHLNRMLRDFWAVGENEVAEFDWRTMIHPDDVGHVSERMADAIGRRDYVSIMARYRNASGQYRILETDARPRWDCDGRFLGFTGVNTDITERRLAESALRESEERFRLLVEASPNGMIMTDGDGHILMMNENGERLFGYDTGELLGRKIDILIPSRRSDAQTADRVTFASPPERLALAGDVHAVRKDGTPLSVEIGINPILTSDGVRIIATVADVSARKRAEAQRELLLAELNHRVKNTLSVVQALAHQSFRRVEPAALATFEGRLMALASAHNLLTRSNWENASLRDIAEGTLHLSGPGLPRIALSGEDVYLGPSAALSVSLALHELFTNAVKYGALSNDDGAIDIAWQPVRCQGRWLRLTWRESGGPPVAPPRHKGFGTLLLEHTLAQDLAGSVDMTYDPCGLICAIEMPLGASGEHAWVG